MAGYTRQSSYTDGDIINASDSNDEFDQLVNAFSNTVGHKHDGSAAEGPVIGLIGDPGVATPINKVVVDDTNNRVGFYVDVSSVSTEQIRVQDGAIVPVTDDDVDLGAVGAEFKNLYIDGTANIDSFVLGTSTAVTSVDTDLTTVSVSDDTLASAKAIKTYVDAQVTAQDLDFQADTGGALNIDLDSEVLTLTGGTGIDTAGSGNTVTFAIDSTVATLTGTQTLTNKTLTTPVISTITNTGTLTLPTTTTTIVGRNTTDTLTNKTLTAPVIATISNTGTLTLPTSTDTLVGRATTDTLTNKTINADNNTVSNLEVDNLKAGVLDTDLTSVAATDTTLASAKAIKTYVDSQVTAQDLDFQGDSGGALSIDLDSETLTIAGGTGIDTSGSLNTLTVAIDSTVATLTGTQTLTNKSIDASQLTGTVANARLDTELQALAGLTSAADKGIQFTGAGTAATYDLTAAGKALLDDADAAAQRTTLGLGTAATSASTDFVAVTGDAMTGDLTFGDNNKAIFGAGSDLQIFHDISHSYIQDTSTGDLRLTSNGSGVMITKTTTENMARFLTDGAVELYYDGGTYTTPKLATTSGGISVTGTASATTFSGDLNGTINSATTGTTQTAGTNNTTIATTAFTQGAANDAAVALAIALG